jgi:hypothetical protein
VLALLKSNERRITARLNVAIQGHSIGMKLKQELKYSSAELEEQP